MAEYRQCPLTGQRVVMAKVRGERPGALSTMVSPSSWPASIDDKSCPFCPGNEDQTPGSLDQWPEQGPWTIRVTPNKYPAFLAELSGDQAACGSHEVIVESPRHVHRPTAFRDDELAQVLSMYARRIEFHRRQGRWRYALVFRNQGRSAGASQPHPHSQLAALATTPKRVLRMLRASRGGAFSRVLSPQSLRVATRGDLLAVCPSASRSAFETWIAPRTAQPRFEESSLDTLADAAWLLRRTIAALEDRFPGLGYNWILYTAPFDTGRYDHYHWHMEIIPRLTTLAGYEWATGEFINPVDPEEAARALAAAEPFQRQSALIT